MTIALIDNFLWCALQVTLLVVAGALLYLLLRRHASLCAALPQWCLAMVVVLSLLVVSPWPSWSWLGQTLSEESQSAQTVFLDVLPELDSAQLSSLENHGFQLKAQPSEEEPPTVEFVPLPSVATTIPTPNSIPWNWGSWKEGFLFLAGISFLLATVRLLFAWRELKKRIRSSVLIKDEKLQAEFSTLHQRYGIARPVTLRESSYDDIPATIGWRRPLILLPSSWREWTPEQRRAVLAHELAHIEHHDFATWLAAQMPLLLHSYHPLVHWFARQLRWEQEISADRRAIEVLGDREGYLTALAELALKPTKNHRPRHEYALAPSSSMLLRRLQMLRKNRTEKTPSAPRFLRGLLLASLCAVLLGVSGLRAQAPNVGTTASITSMVMISTPPPYDADKNTEVFWETQFSLIKSQFVLKAVLEQPQVADTELVKSQKDPVVWLQKELKVSRIPDSPVLRFQFNCPAAEAATGAKIIDALMKIYKQEVDKKQSFQSKRSNVMHQNLTKLHKELLEELQEKTLKYETLVAEIGGAVAPIANSVLNMLINEVRQIQAQIMKKKEELVEITVTKTVAEQQAKSTTALEQAVANELDKDPMIANFNADVYAYMTQILALKAKSKKGTSAEIKRLKETLAQMQQEAERYRKETEIETRKALKSAPNDMLAAIKLEYNLRSNYIKAEIFKLNEEYEEKVTEIEQRGVKSGKLARLDFEILQLQQIEQEMDYKLRSWLIDNQSSVKAIILMPATVTSNPTVSE